MTTIKIDWLDEVEQRYRTQFRMAVYASNLDMYDDLRRDGLSEVEALHEMSGLLLSILASHLTSRPPVVADSSIHRWSHHVQLEVFQDLFLELFGGEATGVTIEHIERWRRT